jgi:hypothetical protein
MDIVAHRQDLEAIARFHATACVDHFNKHLLVADRDQNMRTYKAVYDMHTVYVCGLNEGLRLLSTRLLVRHQKLDDSYMQIWKD